jgi:hypothetical protein
MTAAIAQEMFQRKKLGVMELTYLGGDRPGKTISLAGEGLTAPEAVRLWFGRDAWAEPAEWAGESCLLVFRPSYARPGKELVAGPVKLRGWTPRGWDEKGRGGS